MSCSGLNRTSTIMQVRVEIFVGIVLAIISTTTGLRCYSCSSYMNQCKEVVARSPSHVGRNTCATKCFVRVGEDGAIYRGCFDEFARVVRLQANYIGCRNQTWNNRSLRWCFCSTELCNGVGMDTLESTTESALAKPELSVLRTYTSTTNPAILLNTDRGVFKYVEEEEEEEGKEENNEEANHTIITSRRSTPAARGQVKKRLRSNAVPRKVKLNRAILKQLSGEEYYEIIGKPVELPATARTVKIEHSPNRPRHDVNSANRARSSVEATVKQDEELFDRDYELNDLDYPYNQDMRSISKIVEKLSKAGGPHQQGPSRSGDGGASPIREVRLSKLPESSEVQVKSAKVKSHYEEPLPFSNHVSPELASKMSCEESGYYQHPTDCTLYMACVYDPYTRSPIWHLMRCPEFLFWDNERKICVEFSINCPKTGAIDKPHISKFK